MLKRLFKNLNPFAHLGRGKNGIVFPLLFMLIWTVALEFYGKVIMQNPAIVGLPAIIFNLVYIVYFSFRNGIKGGFVAVIITILYYFYIVNDRKYEGQRLTSSMNTIITLGIVYFIIAGVIGWLKQTIDNLIERETKARIRAQDATKRLEAILKKQKEIVERKDDFINMASHELKTPLTSTQLFIKSFERHLQRTNDEKGQQLLGKIEKQMKKLSLLVKEMLDVTNINQGGLRMNKEEFKINEVIKELAGDLQAITEHKISLNGQTRQTVVGDREKIMQVISNLVTNAIKYSKQDTKIIISSIREANRVIISVQDFGIGISKDRQDKIFGRFYQAHDLDSATYPGLGLGLFIASQIVSLHKGKIWVKSEEGKGSTFFFSLPIK